MAGETDKRGRLAAEPFTYRTTKDGQIFISWQGRRVVTVQGADARRLLARIADRDAARTQLAAAKITGNFKHGNERRKCLARPRYPARPRLPPWSGSCCGKWDG